MMKADVSFGKGRAVRRVDRRLACGRMLVRRALGGLLAASFAAGGMLAGCGEPEVLLEPLRFGPWLRHTIDDGSRGADGVRLADVNGDGRLDVVTPWEQGGDIRLYLHPGSEAVERAWPTVTVGRVGSPEDAVAVDLDGDGAVDVVSSCEGGERTVYVHWAPDDPEDYLDAAAWETEAIPATRDEAQWMFCLPVQIDGENGPDLVVGAKKGGAKLGWLEAPADARDLAGWRFHKLADAGWVMSLVARDMDGDGDTDIVVSDRRGEGRGCFWLENPGAGVGQRLAWVRHRVGGGDHEMMFLAGGDVDGDGREDIVAATRDNGLLWFRPLASVVEGWRVQRIPMPASAGTGKGVAIGDIDLDGQQDIVFTCENAKDRSGVLWMSRRGSSLGGAWLSHDISGMAGAKYDLVELIDLDGDGDLDVLTCEESANLGVIWYENPANRG